MAEPLDSHRPGGRSDGDEPGPTPYELDLMTEG